MRAAAAIVVATLSASFAVSVAAEVVPGNMVVAPAGPYTPFLKVKALSDQEPSAAPDRRVSN